MLPGYTAWLKKQNPATRLLVSNLANARSKKTVLTWFFVDLRSYASGRCNKEDRSRRRAAAHRDAHRANLRTRSEAPPNDRRERRRDFEQRLTEFLSNPACFEDALAGGLFDFDEEVAFSKTALKKAP